MERLNFANKQLKQSNRMDSSSVIVDFLKKNLYSIEPINKTINRSLLGLAYTPGVGAVCLEIQKKPELAEKYTMRGRAIALVSDGSALDSEEKGFLPVMDWLIFQIKHYSGYDAFPFVVRKGTNLPDLFGDLSNSYGTVVYLDSEPIGEAPPGLLILQQQIIAKLTKSQITDAEKTSQAISYFINKRTKGIISEKDYQIAFNTPIKKFVINFVPFTFESNNLKERAIKFHEQFHGKIHIVNSSQSIEELREVFTQKNLRELVKLPGVYSKSSRLSIILTDGTAILGLGNIGPKAGLPVMEGKSLLFRILGDVEVVPHCINPKKTPNEEIEAIMNTIYNYQAVNLEDIKAPECFAIESGLKKLKLLPVFHDDQHGTSIVVLASLINALKVAQKSPQLIKVVINGAGAAGITVAKLLLFYGVKNLLVCDTKGAIYKGRTENMNESKESIAEITNFDKEKGGLADVLKNADVFIGVSAGGALKGQWIHKMNTRPIIFALANPDAEITFEDAKANGVFIYGSGRSDCENQINNSLVFPGIFRAINEHHLKQITQDIKLKAAIAISKCLDKAPTTDYIIPDSLDKSISIVISKEIGTM